MDCYWPETRVFPTIAKAEDRKKLTKQRVLLILKWKLGGIKGCNNENTVSDQNWSLINLWVQKAGETGSEIEALNGLDEIPSIGALNVSHRIDFVPSSSGSIMEFAFSLMDLSAAMYEGLYCLSS